MGILFAFGFTVSAMVSAVAVDAAALYHERRLLQAGVDLAAISAAADPSRAAEIAQSVLVGAQLLAPASTDGLQVVTGRYDPSAVDIASRFTPGAVPANAVSVSLDRPGQLHFAAAFSATPRLDARGLAAVSPQVSFSLGSRLASLNGGLANAILSALLGTEVSLSVLDYTALAAAQVDALAFLDALALRLGITTGTYDDLLSAHAGAGSIAAALADLTIGPANAALLGIAGGGGGGSVALGDMLSLGPLGGLQLGSGGASGLSLSALEILTAAAAFADGDRQVSLNLGAAIPGLVSLSLDLVIGEPAQDGGWFAIGGEGTVLRTAQLRLRFEAQVLGGPILLGANIRLPLWLDLAQAEAQVISAACPSPGSPHGSATIAARPGLARLAIGDWAEPGFSDFGATPSLAPVNLINALLLRVSGSAYVEIAQTEPVVLSFSSAEIGAGTVKTAQTQTLVSSLAGSLLGNLDLTVSVLGLGLSSPSVIAQALRDLLAPLAPTLDLALAGTLSTLGLGIGEADIRVYGVRCDHAVLVG